jgi:hypothetical protein
MIRTWQEQGLLGPGRASAAPSIAETPLPEPASAPPGSAPGHWRTRRRYRLLDTVFDVGFASAELSAAVDPLLNHLATTGPATVSASLEEVPYGFVLTIDGNEADCCQCAAGVAPMVKSALSMDAVNRQRFALCIHAAMLDRGGAALLMPGAPQSGKSCLSAALAKAGFAYRTDEITLLDPGTFVARGVPVALTLKEDGWRLVEPFYPELASLAAHRRVDGKVVKYLPPPELADLAAVDKPSPARWLVFPCYTPEGPNELVSLPHLEALRRLMNECLAFRLEFDANYIQQFVHWVAGTACYKLTFDDLGAAMQLIGGICAGGGLPASSAAPTDRSGPSAATSG